jgi:hypothetical protein
MGSLVSIRRGRTLVLAAGAFTGLQLVPDFLPGVAMAQGVEVLRGSSATPNAGASGVIVVPGAGPAGGDSSSGVTDGDVVVPGVGAGVYGDGVRDRGVVPGVGVGGVATPRVDEPRVVEPRVMEPRVRVAPVERGIQR